VLAAAAGGSGDWTGAHGRTGLPARRIWRRIWLVGSADIRGVLRGDVTWGGRTVWPVNARELWEPKVAAAPSSRRLEATVSSDNWHLGLYAGTPLTDRVFADFSAFYGEDFSTIKRTQQLADGSGDWTRHGVDRGMDGADGDWDAVGALRRDAWSLVPTVRLAYAGSHQGSGREEGAGAFNVVTWTSRVGGTSLRRSA